MPNTAKMRALPNPKNSARDRQREKLIDAFRPVNVCDAVAQLCALLFPTHITA